MGCACSTIEERLPLSPDYVYCVLCKRKIRYCLDDEVSPEAEICLLCFTGF